MAGILYLYRLFINHVEEGSNNPAIHELLCKMEDRLYKYITLNAMSVAYAAAAGMLVLRPDHFSMHWIYAKLLAVIGLTFCTIYAGKLTRELKAGNLNVHSSKTLRILNEIPTLLMIIIVSLVVWKPF